MNKLETILVALKDTLKKCEEEQFKLEGRIDMLQKIISFTEEQITSKDNIKEKVKDNNN